MKPHEALTLLDWKRQIAQLYAQVRTDEHPASAWAKWRKQRDNLFRSHPQSPLVEDRRRTFEGLDHFEYDPRFRVEGVIEEAAAETYEIATSGEVTMTFERFAEVRFEIDSTPLSLELYWLVGYGGGLFLPFRDATSGESTYGAGRYLLDTVKGADLGINEERLILDFNFAYNPSCSYDPRWVCPLAPPPNRLEIPIEAGEKHRE